MTTYHKIDTIFERDINGTKKLIEGKFRNETVEFLANVEWEFTEKKLMGQISESIGMTIKSNLVAELRSRRFLLSS